MRWPVMTGTTGQDALESILQPGKTCWQMARAEKVAFIVDAATYFAAVKDAIARARHAVYLIGWDFDLRIRLEPGKEDSAIPDRLREFLTHVAGERPELQIHILQWDGAMLFNIARQLGSFLLLKAKRKPQLHFRLDSEHPAAACHHQKIVVIDDSLAFCGGIDLTDGRWDTCNHSAGDPRRRRPNGHPYGPWHDTTIAVDGAAAKSLGELSRSRWERATGECLPTPPLQPGLWPEDLTTSCRNVDVAIARTMPAHGDEDGANEVEHLWLAGIRAARKCLYIENQFLSSGAAADALEKRLREEDGPHIVLVMPREAESWAESEVMDSARARIVQRLRSADRHGRFAVYYPVNDEREPIYVHAKLMIVDDRLVRIGSSNLSNRSLQLDSECDIALEASDAETSSAITNLRDSLVAEHLGLEHAEFRRRLVDAQDGLIGVIEAARVSKGPTLRPLEVHELNEAEQALVDSQLFNPERVSPPGRQLKKFGKRLFATDAAKIAGFASVGAVAAVGALALAHRLRRIKEDKDGKA